MVVTELLKYKFLLRMGVPLVKYSFTAGLVDCEVRQCVKDLMMMMLTLTFPFISIGDA